MIKFIFFFVLSFCCMKFLIFVFDFWKIFKIISGYVYILVENITVRV